MNTRLATTWALIVFAVAALGDWALTTYGLSLPGVFETNPNMVAIVANPLSFLGVKIITIEITLLGALALSLLATNREPIDAARRLITSFAMWILAALQLTACIGNIRTILMAIG